MEIFEDYLPIIYHGYYAANQLNNIPEDFDVSNGYPYNVIDCSGSRANGKTINVIRSLLAHMMICSDDIMIFRYIQKSIKQSSHSTIIDQIKQNNLEECFDIKQNYIRCNITGATINYSGLWGQEMNIRSLSPSYKIILIEEAANVTGELWDILLPTVLRFDRILVIPIYNITTTNNPAYVRFHEDKSPETLHIFGTIFDNKLLPESMFKRAEKDKEIMSKEEWEMHYLGIPQQTLRNAIFSSEAISKLTDTNITPMSFDRLIVSLDPAVTSNSIEFDEEQKSNYSGICVVGITNDGICYGLEFIQLIESPDIVINKCIELYHTYKADYILYESNQGGDYIKSLILSKNNTIQVKSYRSIVDKMKRASMLVLPIISDKVKIVSKDDDTVHLLDEMKRCTTVGYIKSFKADSPNLTDCFSGAIIDLLKLNCRGTVNAVLPITEDIDDLFHNSNILLAYNEGNLMYSIDIEVKNKDDLIYMIVNKCNIDSIETFNIDNRYDYGLIPNIPIKNASNNLNNIITIDKLESSSNLLSTIKKCKINNTELLDIWNNYDGTDNTDHIWLRLLLLCMKKF